MRWDTLRDSSRRKTMLTILDNKIMNILVSKDDLYSKRQAIKGLLQEQAEEILYKLKELKYFKIEAELYEELRKKYGVRE